MGEQLLHRAMGFVDGLIDDGSRAASESALVRMLSRIVVGWPRNPSPKTEDDL
jgi:hypothetical protein